MSEEHGGERVSRCRDLRQGQNPFVTTKTATPRNERPISCRAVHRRRLKAVSNQKLEKTLSRERDFTRATKAYSHTFA